MVDVTYSKCVAKCMRVQVPPWVKKRKMRTCDRVVDCNSFENCSRKAEGSNPSTSLSFLLNLCDGMVDVTYLKCVAKCMRVQVPPQVWPDLVMKLVNMLYLGFSF